jgi:glycosyltransferase involved in cell wall biosynthesis
VRIVHWFPNFLAGGGVANAVLGLANAQAAAGADVSIASLAHDRAIYGSQQLDQRVRLTSWEGGTARGIGGLRIHAMRPASMRALRAMEPDVVHVHAEFNPDNWWPPRIWRCPLVLSPHGAFHPAVRQRGARAKWLYAAVAQPLLYARATRLHALSPAEARDIRAALPDAVTYCVPQGPSPSLRSCETSGVVRDDGPVSFMFVGRIDVQVKGLDVLIEAFARAVRASGSAVPARLALVGPDWRGGIASMRDLARNLGVEELVDFHGTVPADRIGGLIGGCDVYVQLSRNEGSPLSLNDALVLGKPAIVSDRIGTVSSPEVARLPHVSVVEPSPDQAARAIEAALHDLDGLRAAARAARGEIASFLSWERAAVQHLETYAQIAGP